MDRIQSLRAYVATAEGGTFAAAARRLGVVPSVITQRVGALEAELGEPLFARTTRSVRLTPLGERHLARAVQLLGELDALVGDSATPPTDLVAHLRIKVPTALATQRLRPAFAQFQTQHPRVTLDIVLLDRHISVVEEGFDLAIGVVQSHPEGVIEMPLCPTHRLLCASPAYLARHGVPGHPRDLIEHACLTFFPTQAEWRFERRGTTVRLAVRPHFSANDLVLVRQAAIDGNGITLLPDHVANDALACGQLVRVLADWRVPSGELRALVPKHRAADSVILALLDVIRAAMVTS